ncbi:MAG: hypothetical protein JO232_08985 [Verrucomicrobia bacterium]|nr:hypothetical protein [Verrucomicrobiota bacterium]
MLSFLPLPHHFIVLPDDTREPALSLQREIETIWLAEISRTGSKVFNGSLFSVEQVSDQTVTGRFVEYRSYVAQIRRPELFSELRIQPLAVTGLLRNTDGIFFGYRSPGVAQQPNFWELIPAGGIDRKCLAENGEIVPIRQLLAELEEEVGLAPADVSASRLVSFCEDPEHHMFDLVWELQTTLDTTKVLSSHAALPATEHAKIICVPWRDLDRFLAKDSPGVLPSNRDLLAHLGLMTGENTNQR